jgi:ParB-like chromosome segregation protein Spo0J
MTTMKENVQKAFQSMVSGAGRDAQPSRQHKPLQKKRLPPESVDKLRAKLDVAKRVVQKIPLEFIHLDSNVRKHYDAKSLDNLAASMDIDGLIQYPTLFLRETPHGAELVCGNGHRRILAANKLDWESIECMIVSCEDEKHQLYHVLNANMRESVFYLDLALAYKQAAQLGESDESTGKRVGVNARTVSWYRRLSELSPKCMQLIRENPILFNATWGINMARRGPLPDMVTLQVEMEKMISANKSWIPDNTTRLVRARPKTQPSRDTEQARQALKLQMRTEKDKTTKKKLLLFLSDLHQSGLLSEKKMKEIIRTVWDDETHLPPVCGAGRTELMNRKRP